MKPWQFLHEGHAVDCILFHQYRYYVLNQPELKDAEYDHLEREVARQYPGQPVLQRVGSSSGADYPVYVREMRRPNIHERKERDAEWLRPADLVDQAFTYTRNLYELARRFWI